MALDFTTTFPTEAAAQAPAAIERLKAMMQPLKAREPDAVVHNPKEDLGFSFRGKGTQALADALRPIGLRINPTMSPGQVGAWIAAMIAALSDLPARVSVPAAQDALHATIRFFPEVDGVIREKAKPHAARYAAAIMRLENLQREIAQASAPKLMAPADDRPLDIRAMARSDLGRALLRMGVANGHISQEDFDAAMVGHAED